MDLMKVKRKNNIKKYSVIIATGFKASSQGYLFSVVKQISKNNRLFETTQIIDL